MDDGSRLLATIVLLCCAVYFAVTETAVSSCSRAKIKAASEHGDTKALNALFVLDNFDKAITTILIGTNIVHISIASLVTLMVISRWGVGMVSISTIITTITVFFVGEMLPKSIAKKYSERAAMRCCGVLRILMKLFSPLSFLLTKFTDKLSSLSEGGPEVSVTEDELYDIIEDMTEEGSLNEEQGDLISSAIQFADVTVESILTPRVDVVAIDVDDNLAEILSVVKTTNHSRLPVYEGSIDNIIGVLRIRSFIKAYMKLGDRLELKPILDKAMYVHQSAKIAELLPELSKKRVNLAVVTDNYGGTLGIVTVEDILEELVGEIWDEDDVIEENIVSIGDNVWRVDAEESVSDVFEQLEFEDPEENEALVNTLMGEWAYEQFTSIPQQGDGFDYHGLRICIAQIQHNRILKLRVEKLPENGGEEE